MKVLNKISDGIDNVIRCVCAVLMIGFFLVMLLQVILRNLFPAHTLSWADGICRYMFVWATFLGACLATKIRSHIAITFIIDRFKGKVRKVIDVVIYIFTLVMVALLFVWSISATKNVIPQQADSAHFSAAFVYAALPVGFLLLFVQTAICFIQDAFFNMGDSIEREDMED